MFRRAVLVGAVLAAAMAPGAQAAKLDSFWVSAAATSTPAAGGKVLLSVGCETTDFRNHTFYIYKCSVGPVSATVPCGFECFGLPVAARTALAPAGSYELCVGAASFGQTSENFHECVPLDPVTGAAVITR